MHITSGMKSQGV